MNHDITHCAGEGCTRRGTCHRYMAHLDNGAPRVPRSYITWQGCVNNGHNMYWPEDEDEPQKKN